MRKREPKPIINQAESLAKPRGKNVSKPLSQTFIPQLPVNTKVGLQKKALDTDAINAIPKPKSAKKSSPSHKTTKNFRVSRAPPAGKMIPGFGCPSGDIEIPKEWLKEDPVANQSKAPESKNSANAKYQSLDLGELIGLSIEMAQDKIKLSRDDQDLAFKLSVNESKLAELEQELAEDDDSDQASIDVFCVIDRSGSMRGEKLEQVKISLGYLLELLKPTDRISISLFDNTGVLLLAPKMIGPSKKIIQDAINSIQDRGATNIRSGLELAFDAIINRETRNQVTGVMLLTDGLDNSGTLDPLTVENFFNSWRAKMEGHEFTFHTFGYGHDHDAALMEQMATLNGGNFYYVSNLETVSDTFVDCLGGLLSVIGQNAYINLCLAPNGIWPEIRFQRTYGEYFSGDRETVRVLKLNNLVKDYKKDFMFEVRLPGVKDPDCLEEEPLVIKLVDAKLSVQNLDNVYFNKSCAYQGLVYNQETPVEILVNGDVTKNIVRVKAGDVIEIAQEMASKGQYEAGERLLEEQEGLLGGYQDDELFRNMKENLGKQRGMIANSRNGIANNLNVKAFSKNCKAVFSSQKPAPQMCGQTNQNRCQIKMSSRLEKCKASSK